MSQSTTAYGIDRRVVLLLATGLVAAFLALLWPSAADAQRPLRKPCLDPKRTLTVAEVGGTGSYTGREPLLNCVTQSSARTFTAQKTCTFHCQHWHTWIPSGVPLEPFVQLSAAAAGSYLLRWSDNCTPRLGQARSDCTVRLGATPTTVTATYGVTPDTAPPSAPGAGAPTPSSYSATIRWSPAADNVSVAGYDVFRSDRLDPVARVGPTATSAVVRDLFCLTAYTFRVEAFDASGNAARSADIPVTTGRCGPTSRPNTVLHLVPSKRTRSRTAFFHYGVRGSVRATKFQCKLDRGRWTRCRASTGKRYRNLRPGAHTFRVRAGNSLGFDRTPAAYRWRVVRR
jgi:hypothetical protein